MVKRTFVITGAGSGIGQAIAQTLASSGDDLILVGRRLGKLEEVKRALPRSEDHLVVPADTTDGSGLRQAFKELNLSERNISGLIANAGVGGENQYGDSDRWDEIININLKGVYVFVNEALPYLRQSSSEYKHITVVSSVLAHLGVPGYSAYCSSKAGLLGLVRSWASEFAKEKILVNALCPGWVDTDMARDGIQSFADMSGKSFDESMDFQMSLVPLRKMTEPSEIGDFVKFLVADEQRSITGQSLNINNGQIT